MADTPDLSPAAQIEIRHLDTGAVLRAVQADTLAGAYLREAYLTSADLRGADLTGAYFRGAYLRGAYLVDANLTGAYLVDAHLRHADFTGAVLRDAVLRDADLTGANLWGADLRGADLRGANLWGADLRGAVLRDAVLRDADLRRADLTGARIGDHVVTTVVAQLQRSDGYGVIAFSTDRGEIIVCAGCWSGTLAEARAYKAGADYASADENSVICDFIDARARQLKLLASAARGGGQ